MFVLNQPLRLIMETDTCLIIGIMVNTIEALHQDADVERLREGLYEAFYELRAAAGVEPIQPQVMKAAASKGRAREERVNK